LAEGNGELGYARLGYLGGVEVSSVRILVVEDFEPFRRFISSTLEKNYDLQVVAEVSDVGDAVGADPISN
jgi:hypothetical protein